MVATAAGTFCSAASLGQDPVVKPAGNEAKSGRNDPRKSPWLVTCRDTHLRETGKPDCWTAMDAINADGAEVGVDEDLSCSALFDPKAKYSLNGSNNVKALASRFKDSGRRISAFCLHSQFDTRGEKEIEFTLKVAAVAAELGVPAIRLDVVPRQIKDQAEFLKFAVGVGKKLVAETAKSKVRFGVENHGGTTNKVEFMKELLDGVGSDRFGVTLDTANLYWFGYPLSKLYRIYADYGAKVCHTHCKSIKYPEADREKQRKMGFEYDKRCCPVYEGDIDFAKLAAILKKTGYQGDLCIENESLGRFPVEERLNVLKKEVAYLRGIAAKV